MGSTVGDSDLSFLDSAPSAPVRVGTDSTSTAAPKPPNASDLESTIAGIESRYEPEIRAGEKAAEGYEEKSIAAEQSIEEEATKEAGELSAEDQQMQFWIDHTPTRQAAYATTMKAAPVLAILTALGGKATKLSGQNMLGALNGMVKGLNSASEKTYNDALQRWQSAYEKMRQQQQRLSDAHKLMLTAYAGRADAYQKASDAARRMVGDELDDKQRQISQTIDTFKAQSTAWGKIQQINMANASLADRIRLHIAEEDKWKQATARANQAADPVVKQQVAGEEARWRNAKAQEDANLRRRGQIAANLTMPDDQKQAALERIDSEDEALEMEMNRAVSNRDAIVAGYAASGGKPGASPTPAPRGGAGTPAPNGSSGGTWGGQSQELPPEAVQKLKDNIGKSVTFANGQTWVMHQDGTTSRVQ
jgi:hypothetical protein